MTPFQDRCYFDSLTLNEKKKSQNTKKTQIKCVSALLSLVLVWSRTHAVFTTVK